MTIRRIAAFGMTAIVVAGVALWVRGRTSLRCYADYRRIKPAPMQVDLRAKAGSNYYAVVSHEDPSSLNSGPPIHVFDAAGNLVDQTPDCGDDPAFKSRWDNTFVRRMTVEETDKDLLKKR